MDFFPFSSQFFWCSMSDQQQSRLPLSSPLNSHFTKAWWTGPLRGRVNWRGGSWWCWRTRPPGASRWWPPRSPSPWRSPCSCRSRWPSGRGRRRPSSSRRGGAGRSAGGWCRGRAATCGPPGRTFSRQNGFLFKTHSIPTAKQLFPGFIFTFSFAIFTYLRPEQDCYAKFTPCST